MNRTAFLKLIAALPLFPTSLAARPAQEPDDGFDIDFPDRPPPLGPVHAMVRKELDAAAERWGGRDSLSFFDLHPDTLEELWREFRPMYDPGGFVQMVVDGVRGAPNTRVERGGCHVYGQLSATMRVQISPEIIQKLRGSDRAAFEKALERKLRDMNPRIR